MRKSVLTAAGLAILAVVTWSAAPAQAMAIAAPAALKSASDSVKLTETVNCWDCGDWGDRTYHHEYYLGDYDRSYRPYYRSYYRPYHRSYYRSYDDGCDCGYGYGYHRPYYRSYYRPHYRSYGYNGWAPRPRYFYFGPAIYAY
jgi:hypothetical protein